MLVLAINDNLEFLEPVGFSEEFPVPIMLTVLLLNMVVKLLNESEDSEVEVDVNYDELVGVDIVAELVKVMDPMVQAEVEVPTILVPIKVTEVRIPDKAT